VSDDLDASEEQLCDIVKLLKRNYPDGLNVVAEIKYLHSCMRHLNLRGMKRRKAGEHCIMRNFVRFTK
jgi:hypothetical protein